MGVGGGRAAAAGSFRRNSRGGAARAGGVVRVGPVSYLRNIHRPAHNKVQPHRGVGFYPTEPELKICSRGTAPGVNSFVKAGKCKGFGARCNPARARGSPRVGIGRA